jgi:NADPH2:quinone reductase
VLGRDGVGETGDGRRVYFDGPTAPYGSMAEQTLVAATQVLELPRELDVDVAVAAALGNAGLAALLPLSQRAKLAPGESVLVLGAGGVVGSLAVQLARKLGAGKVVGVVRGDEAAGRVERLGAHRVIDTSRDQLAQALRDTEPRGFDVVVDYLWGPVAAAALEHVAVGARFVHVGAVLGDELMLSGARLRSKHVDMLGYVTLHVPAELRAEAYRSLLTWAARGELEVPVRRYPLEALDEAWRADGLPRATRAVLTP